MKLIPYLYKTSEVIKFKHSFPAFSRKVEEFVFILSARFLLGGI